MSEAFKKVLPGLFVVVFMVGMTVPSHADTITVYAVADAEITGYLTGSSANTSNWGGLGYLTGNVGRAGGPTSAQFPNYGDSRGLFLFDLASIPVGSTITSVNVTLFENWKFGTSSSSLSLYQVTSSWSETGVTYDSRPTWNFGQSWGMGYSSSGHRFSTGTTTGTLATLVQKWVDNPGTNFGLITSDTYSSTSLLRILAHEATGTSTDPKLTITYTPPPLPVPEPATLSLLGLGMVGLMVRRGRRD